ncbi:4-hydroxy-tetrahydrodipicolinate synthase [Buchnera aphidicola (Pterocallis alni)]|uniref:4-hydroxy-tetrahydrodipicolinate synthase n=1 Tax=Buchnera aphidicola TaxID=9 RepID=UPI003464BBA2
MLTGSIVALITPMDSKGNICKISLKKLITYHMQNNTKAIVTVGTTGESSTLTPEEHHYLVLQTIDFSQGKIPIIAGTGANSTGEAILLTKKIENTGIAACLTVTPYYNKPTQKGLYQHFKSIAESTNIPQILYNVPTRTGCDILPETVIKLSRIHNIIGIKEATGDLSRVYQIKKKVQKDFILLSGDDNTALDFIQLGGDGVISVTANIEAKKMATMCDLALNKDFSNARLINSELTPIHKALFLEPNPIPVKWAAWKLGLIKRNNLRLPLTQLSKNSKNIINKVINKSHIIM